MKWEVVRITGNKSNKNTPFASVGLGRITLSSTACELIDNFEKYDYAIFLKARKDGAMCVGIKLLESHQENALRICRRKYKGKVIERSFSIDNKQVVEELFGVQGTNKSVVRYPITVDSEERDTLVVRA